MSSLSLCMIVKDEEALLPRCLESVQGVVDEVVVVDTGSRDRTIALAREFRAQVYEFAWVDDFAAARNYALQWVTGDWVLVLDADEVLLPDVVPLMRQAIAHPDHLVVNLVRQEVGSQQSPYSLISRLFRRHPGLQFERPYHELIDDSVARLIEQEPHWKVVDLSPVAIWHDGYTTGAIASRNKQTRAKTILSGFLANHPHDAYVCSKLGALYLETGEVSAGQALLQRGLKSPDLTPALRYELHYHLGIAHTHTQKLELAIAHYRQATQQAILPTLKLGAYNNWANLLKDHGDLTGAQHLYEQAIQIEPKFAVGHYNLGMVLKAQGKWLEAIAAYQQAISLQPTYAEAYQNLGVVWLKLGNVSESLQAFGNAIALHDQQKSPEAERLRQGLREMGFTIERTGIN